MLARLPPSCRLSLWATRSDGACKRYSLDRRDAALVPSLHGTRLITVLLQLSCLAELAGIRYSEMFPTRGLLGGIVGTAICYLFGIPDFVSIFFGVVLFLGMGGARYFRIAIRTLPRDLRGGLGLVKIFLQINQHTSAHRTVADIFVETVNRHPNKPAIVCSNDNQKWTFRELNDYSNRVANHFRSQGLQRGDVVALFVENSPEFLGVFLGLSKIGVISAFINFNLRQEALAHCIRVSGANTIIFTAALSDPLLAVLPDLDASLTDMCYSVAGESTIPQAKSLDRELEGASPLEPPPTANKQFTDILCYVYTSGTTGMPKACIIKGNRYYHFASGVTYILGVLEDDVVYCTLPLYHTNGGILSSGQMILRGCTLVLRKKFSASNFWTDCIKHKCTVFFYIGEVCRYLLSQPKRPTDTQHCIRKGIGNGLKKQIWLDFQRRFHVDLIQEFYGSTEGNTSLANVTGKTGSCGFISVVLPVANPVSLIKIDPTTGEYVRNSSGFCVQAGVGEPGEMAGVIRKRIGEFDGYQDEKATRKKVMYDVFRAGDAYFLSGDIIRMDEEGYLYFCDRTGDTFRWKGENVSTTEVEGTIANILELRDVVVYGVEVPGAEGRAGMAAIVGTADKLNLSNLAQQLHLSLPPYAVPVFIRLVEKVELTSTFKPQKVKLRNEGYNMDQVSDPLYFNDPAQKAYVPLTSEVYQQLLNGSIRL